MIGAMTPPAATLPANPLGFISFSHQDEAWLEKLKVFLKPLHRHGRLQLWDDSKIRHGAEWYEDIRRAMETARVAFVLVSPDFLASDFCMMEEFPYLVERAEAGGLMLLPILVRPCSSEVLKRERWLPDHQARPSLDQPLSTLAEPEVERRLSAIVDESLTSLEQLPERKPLETSWPLDRYEVGRDQPSFDKQPLRDWLEASGWNKQPPGPTLPDDVVAATSERYLEASRRITGAPLPD